MASTTIIAGTDGTITLPIDDLMSYGATSQGEGEVFELFPLLDKLSGKTVEELREIFPNAEVKQ